MPEMDDAAIDAFLKTPNRHAVMATNRPGRPPQISPVWYLWEDRVLYVSIPVGSAKHRLLTRDRNVSVCVDGGRNDVRAVMLYGKALLRDGSNPLTETMRWRITRAYYETEAEARAYYETIEDTPSVLVVLDPQKIVSQDYND